MEKIKTIIFTTERNHRWLKKHEDDIREALNKTKNAEFEEFVYRYAPIVQPETYTNSEGKTKIKQSWFDNTFTEQARILGFNACAFHFTQSDRKKWGMTESINGSYFRDTDKVWEFWVCADEGERSSHRQKDRRIRQYERVFLHEFAHGLIHWYHNDRREDVHTYDYRRSDIKSLFPTITAVKGKTPAVIPRPQPTPVVDNVETPKAVELEIDHRYAMDNYWQGNNPRSFMFHTTGGYGVEGAVETLKARGLSYNFIIDQGKVYQLVDWRNSAWHAGVVKQPNQRAQVFYENENPNKHSVGVAFTYPEGPQGISVLSDKDIDAAVLLMKKVGQEAEVRYNADNIFYHQEVTYDKPIMVKGYRRQIVDALVGDKDTKDAGEMTKAQLRLKYLLLKLKYYLLLKKLRTK